MTAVVGCATAGTHTPRASQSPTSKPNFAKPPPPAVSEPPIPSNSQTPVDTYLTCGEVRVSSVSWWELQAVAPATCQQANAILRKALTQMADDQTATIDGWECHSGPLMYPGIKCYKGQLLLVAKLYS